MDLFLIALFFLTFLLAVRRKIPLFQTFLSGTQEGFEEALKLLPVLLPFLLLVGVLRASGALDGLQKILAPVAAPLGIPGELLPMALLRPFSGSGTLALLNDLLKNHGPDSFLGRAASVLMGSTETTFYTIAVYYGAVGVRHFRYTVFAALLADAAGLLFSVLFTRLFFG